MPFALLYIENRVLRALYCVVSYCVYVVARIRVPREYSQRQKFRLKKLRQNLGKELSVFEGKLALSVG
ncbi:hypothetical protein SBA1_220007 [Candidatus Sulfotelmatobacter kueseliae]|uniref:Uncharacterized protein n=1 Tax=Candidatus Sulfotelmatobacter kueseliae TaxID=2042962 RepID=A0A2U3KGX6_9BACT|nr:hypothetical protein SBA1_220007 [Candidatus Sulfotelmatobacter kueseliae]